MEGIDKLPIPQIGNSPYFNEFSVGAMLPQRGNPDPNSDTEFQKRDILDIIADTNSKIEEFNFGSKLGVNRASEHQ